MDIVSGNNQLDITMMPLILEGLLGIEPSQTDLGSIYLPVDISILLSNEGTVAGTKMVVCKINGSIFGQQTVTLNPGQNLRVHFSFSPITAGTYNIWVDGFIGSVIINPKPRTIAELQSLACSNRAAGRNWYDGMTYPAEYNIFYKYMYDLAANGQSWTDFCPR